MHHASCKMLFLFDLNACAPGQAQLERILILDQRKALIVIDDTNDDDTQINMLLPQGRLHASTLVLITSRDRNVLMQRCSDVHEVGMLHQVLAMQLFAAWTFPTGSAEVAGCRVSVKGGGGLRWAAANAQGVCTESSSARPGMC